MTGDLIKNIDALERFLRGKRLSLFLDYDGTLTPIVGRPENAYLSFDMKVLLEKIVRLYPTVIISGRSLDDVKALVGIEGPVYAGNHGMEIRDDGFSFIYDTGRGVREEMKRLKARIKAMGKRFPGVIVEDKGLTLSIHYRLLDVRHKNAFARGFMDTVSSALKRGLVRVTEGKKVFEIRPPVEWHKGRAVEWILERRPFKGTFPIYMGDDETDRDGFRAVKDRGLSVFVGGSSTEADCFIRRQRDVKVFLKRLCQVS